MLSIIHGNDPTTPLTRHTNTTRTPKNKQGLAATLRLRHQRTSAPPIHTLWLRHRARAAVDAPNWEGVDKILNSGVFDRLRTLGVTLDVSASAVPQGIGVLAAFFNGNSKSGAICEASIEELRLHLAVAGATTTTSGPEIDLTPLVPPARAIAALPKSTSPQSTPPTTRLAGLRALGISGLDATKGLPSLGRLLVHLPLLDELTLGNAEVTAAGIEGLCRPSFGSQHRGQALRTLQFIAPVAKTEVAAHAASDALARLMGVGAFPSLERLLVWYSFDGINKPGLHGQHFLGGHWGLDALSRALLQRRQRLHWTSSNGAGRGLKWLRVGRMTPTVAERLAAALGPDCVVEEAL